MPRLACLLPAEGRKQARCLCMMNFTELPSVPPGRLAPFTDQLRLAVATYLAWFKGSPPRLLSSPLKPSPRLTAPVPGRRPKVPASEG